MENVHMDAEKLEALEARLFNLTASLLIESSTWKKLRSTDDGERTLTTLHAVGENALKRDLSSIPSGMITAALLQHSFSLDPTTKTADISLLDVEGHPIALPLKCSSSMKLFFAVHGVLADLPANGETIRIFSDDSDSLEAAAQCLFECLVG